MPHKEKLTLKIHIMPVTIYHNPRCSKSREALLLIRETGIEPRIVSYLEAPLTAQEIDSLLARLSLEDPRQIMRTKEPA